MSRPSPYISIARPVNGINLNRLEKGSNRDVFEATGIPSARKIWFPGETDFDLSTSALLVALKRSKTIPIVLVSAAVLAPLFWQPLIHAGDLPSHVYNAWLTILIQQGHAPGLWLAHLRTNVAFDIALVWLLGRFPVGIAERIALSAVVLVFFWGAFSFVSVVSGRRPWFAVPLLGMLAYGWVFQIGFLNFYLSTGLSLFLLAIVWRGHLWLWTPIMALPLLVLAWLAHPIPVLWLLGVAAYVLLARQLSPKLQLFLLLAALGVLVLLRQFLFTHYKAFWLWRQLLFITGADQVWVFGREYLLLALLLVLLGATVLLHQSGAWIPGVPGIAAQIYLLTAASIFLLPEGVLLPHEPQPGITFIGDRMSLFSAVLACAVIGAAKPQRWHKVGFALVAALYFCFLCVDAYAIGTIENRLENLVSSLPPGHRVIALPPLTLTHDYTQEHVTGRIDNTMQEWMGRLPFLWRLRFYSLEGSRIGLDHMVDRVCVGRCFSYFDYEPMTEVFRVRALPGNPIALMAADSAAMQNGTYIVKQADLPLDQIYYCGPRSTDICIRSLHQGELNAPPRYSQ